MTEFTQQVKCGKMAMVRATKQIEPISKYSETHRCSRAGFIKLRCQNDHRTATTNVNAAANIRCCVG